MCRRHQQVLMEFLFKMGGRSLGCSSYNMIIKGWLLGEHKLEELHLLTFKESPLRICQKLVKEAQKLILVHQKLTSLMGRTYKRLPIGTTDGSNSNVGKIVASWCIMISWTT
ncbi:uncharacterized protein LOC120008485 isoform X2 [Tripterygium wilfordii]|uniref:uncharacterized protein LOC120008485 isoform X2 n=1 Tax=Tripterygium wilfordii TaxID=458696 RepID=UPI0018F83876|nr:uncharacterized protein LOC120008485 isoform X2 [Tripterygium wilfordii]XP_038714745.1 uncharacterized protein LOC120008485 isoform X2 [Tripterygium wilfordii]XP_038714746.1 uncharacterized protein LOC120008485 isoform X2 [Tripterygium wilfordii]